MIAFRWPNRKKRGATLVETALVLPVILVVMITIVEYSRYYYIQSVLFNSAREGARYGIVRPGDTAGITNAARRYLVGLGEGNVNVAMSYPNPNNPSQCNPNLPTNGDPIRVTVSYRTRLLIPYPFGKTLNLIRKSEMQIESQWPSGVAYTCP